MSKQNLKFRGYCVVFLFIQLLSINVFGQEYGLEFLGHEVVTDKRTSLILGNDPLICPKNDFELSFELKFKPNVSSYFGYVFRIITQDNKNIDLLFQADSKGKNHKFRIISGDKDINLTNKLDSVSLYTKWNLFRFKIEGNQIQIFCNNQLLSSGKIPFVLKQCFKIYFGECSNPKFLTSDVLPMYLRDVIVKSGDEKRHHWPLREIFGDVSYDNIAHYQAISKNAQWLLKRHYEWKLLKEVKFKGNGSFAFDPVLKKIVINSDAKTYFFNAKDASLVSKDFTQKYSRFTFGDMGIFLKNKQKLVNVRLNENKIFTYNNGLNSWDISPDEKFNLTEYWHHNKYIYPTDSALVLMGGYGQFKYKNRFQKYSFQSNSWTDLKLKGDEIEPRYMFGLGNQTPTKSYIFGGYGSKTGDQGLNPQNYYDLYEIDWRQNAVRKVYDLKTPEVPFVVASSLIINEKSDSFYGLIYNQLKYNSALQLIEGSLTKPEIKKISKEIPYKFIDVASNADLYFDKENSKLYCVTSFFELLPVDSTKIAIYSLDFPPSNLPIEVKAKNSFAQKATKFLLFLIPFFLMALLGWYFLSRKKKTETLTKTASLPIEKLEVEPIVNVVEDTPKNEISKAKVLLFGGFQFLNEKEIDLTNQFTPLLKEMFLYLLLHSIKWNKGVNSSELNEMFWYDKTTNSARNNRSVNITKLKTIFEQLSSIQITKDTGNWKIVFDPTQIYIDYFQFQKLTNSKKALNAEQIKSLTDIINRGGFLSNLEYEWLDDFKGEISNKIIDAYLAYCEGLKIATDSEEIIEIADNIFKFDSVDETAMSLKCRALVHLGKHSLAKSSYEKFAKDYARLYSEKYAISYKEVLES